MSFDAFLSLPEIHGKSLDAARGGVIEMAGYPFGSHQSISTSASIAGGAAGNVMAGWDRSNNICYA